VTTNAVEVEGVSKVFGETIALDNLSLSFEPGIVYGLLGPNGAGKTTIIRVLATLLKPTGGHARVFGVDVARNANEVRSRIGLAGQYAAVDEFQTGRENVEMVGKLYNLSTNDAKTRAEEVLERIRLTDAADRQVKTYSGGMRRRLDLAASMVGKPDLLFLDEPTTGIDPRSRLDLWELIEDLVKEGTTVLLTTQYLDEADRLADRIGVIDHGRLIAEGTESELKLQVGGEVVETKVRPENLERAVAAIQATTHQEARVVGHTVTVPAGEGALTLASVIRALDEIDVHPTDIGVRRPTLNDVFLTLTGRQAEDEAEPAPAAGRGRRSRP
jgi:ABC-2 type transport system ATP-binding protein